MLKRRFDWCVLAVASALACSTTEGPGDAATRGGQGGGGTASGRSGASNSGAGGAAGSLSGRSGGPSGGAASSGRGGSSSGGAPAGRGGASEAGSSGLAGANSSTAGATPQGGGTGEENGGAGAGGDGDIWRPIAGLRWQWQLSESLAEPLDVDVYDIDWEADASDVQRLHERGISVVCYVSVGSWEDFRPDADDFPAEVIGNDYDGWPGEKYVDIRAEGLRSVMLKRFDVCAAKGFDAIEPDNMDVFELGADSGFPLTRADGIAYAEWLATEAHARGLGIGQKNASSITSSIHAQYEWALTEDCYGGGRWCDEVSAYLDENKPVFMCEYDEDSFDAACSFGLPLHYSPILKTLDLDATITFCP